MKLVVTPIKRGPSGKALVVPNKRSLVITLNGKEYNFLRSDIEIPVPENLRAGDYFVSLSRDEAQLWSIRPWNATVVGIFKNFAAKKNTPPVPEPPRQREGIKKDGTTFPKDWLEFKVIFELVEPREFAGLNAVGTLRYNFTKDGEGNAGFSNPNAQSTAELVNFLDRTTGDASNLVLPFSDNLLPDLEKRLVALGRRVMLIIENGYIKTMGEPVSAAPVRKRVPVKPKPKAKKK